MFRIYNYYPSSNRAKKRNSGRQFLLVIQKLSAFSFALKGQNMGSPWIYPRVAINTNHNPTRVEY